MGRLVEPGVERGRPSACPTAKPAAARPTAAMTCRPKALRRTASRPSSRPSSPPAGAEVVPGGTVDRGDGAERRFGGHGPRLRGQSVSPPPPRLGGKARRLGRSRAAAQSHGCGWSAPRNRVAATPASRRYGAGFGPKASAGQRDGARPRRRRQSRTRSRSKRNGWGIGTARPEQSRAGEHRLSGTPGLEAADVGAGLSPFHALVLRPPLRVDRLAST